MRMLCHCQGSRSLWASCLCCALACLCRFTEPAATQWSHPRIGQTHGAHASALRSGARGLPHPAALPP
eukprot:15478100-Alexandrium_andersonii.AAC.1